MTKYSDDDAREMIEAILRLPPAEIAAFKARLGPIFRQAREDEFQKRMAEIYAADRKAGRKPEYV